MALRSYSLSRSGRSMPLVAIRPTTLLFLLIASLHPFGPPAGAAVQGGPFGAVIRAIDYDADGPLVRDHYDPMIGIQPGDVLTRTGIRSAIQKLYDTRRFSSIAVDAIPAPDGVRVVFRLHFSYYFNDFSVQGDVDLGGRTLTDLVELPVGERYTDDRLEGSRKAVVQFLRERGFYGAEVLARTQLDQAELQVNTVFEIETGRQATLDSLNIHGVPDNEILAMRQRLGLKQGKKYSRRSLEERLENLRSYLIQRGYLEARPEIKESYSETDNTVTLDLNFLNFGRVRVVLEGFKVPEEQKPRLLPVLSGEGIDPALLEEGRRNLKEYLEERGYSEAEVSYGEETQETGTLVLRYQVVPGRRVSVAYVLFRGNNEVSAGDLQAAIQIRPQGFLQKSVYSISKLDSDVDALKSLYRSRGYLDVEVIPLVEPIDDAEKLGIVFEITEGELARTGTVSIVGNREMATELLMARLRLREGSRFSPTLAEQDRQTLLAVYNDAGYLRARVLYSIGDPDSEGALPVEFRIEEGTRLFVDRIFILGNNHTRDSVIAARIGLDEGEPLSLDKMLQTQQALSDLGVFDNVLVGQQFQESDTPHQNLIVRVKESRRYTVRYGLGYETREKVRGILELSDINVLGLAKRADLRFRASTVEQAAILTLQQSQVQFLPVNSYLSLSASAEDEVSFDQTRFNTSYQFSKPLSTHSWALLRANYRNVRVYNLQVSEALAREDAPRNLTTLSAIYVNDTRDNFLDAEQGFFTSTNLSVTTRWLGSNNYLSLYTQDSYHRRIPGNLVLAASLRVGLARPYGRDDSIPISERYFAGGASSLRGFGTDRAGPVDPETGEPTGGNSLLIGNLELRLPLVRMVRLAGFYDGGNVFGRIKDIRFADFSHTIGIGLRVKTPLGPLRLDYGYNLNLPERLKGYGYKPGHFFITIGPPF